MLLWLKFLSLFHVIGTLSIRLIPFLVFLAAIVVEVSVSVHFVRMYLTGHRWPLSQRNDAKLYAQWCKQNEKLHAGSLSLIRYLFLFPYLKIV